MLVFVEQHHIDGAGDRCHTCPLARALSEQLGGYFVSVGGGHAWVDWCHDTNTMGYIHTKQSAAFVDAYDLLGKGAVKPGAYEVCQVPLQASDSDYAYRNGDYFHAQQDAEQGGA